MLFRSVTALVGGLLVLAVRYDPRRANIARSADALGIVVVALSLLVAVVQSAIINSGFGEAARLDQAAPIVIGSFFAILGYAMLNIRQNYTIGIRLPWTLESEEAWDAAHRFIGQAWLLLGVLVMVLGAVTWSLAALVVFFLGLVMSTCGSAIVAYRTWNKT